MSNPSKPQRQVGREQVEEFVSGLFEADLHAKRVASLVNGVDGVLHAASLGVRAIGQGLAAAQGLVPRHAVKQVDRLLSNPQLSMEQIFSCWVRFVVGEREEIFVNFDWTEFEDSDQSMVVLGVQTGHGRSTPLVWKTVTRSQLKERRNEHEDDLLILFAAVAPGEVRVTVVADRGFGDCKLYRLLEEIGFEYLIRFRGVIGVEAQDGERRKTREWVGPRGRMRVLRQARVTGERQSVPLVVCVQDRGMKDAWCLATSRKGSAPRNGKNGALRPHRGLQRPEGRGGGEMPAVLHASWRTALSSGCIPAKHEGRPVQVPQFPALSRG